MDSSFTPGTLREDALVADGERGALVGGRGAYAVTPSCSRFTWGGRDEPGSLNDAEGAFLLSGFHMALATHQQGRQVEAVRWFERSRGALGPPGLFTEEFDVVQRQLRGNLPQAFVHRDSRHAAAALVPLEPSRTSPSSPM